MSRSSPSVRSQPIRLSPSISTLPTPHHRLAHSTPLRTHKPRHRPSTTARTASSGISITTTTLPAGGNSGGATAVAGDAAAAGITQAAGERFHFTSGSSNASYTLSGLEDSGTATYTVTVFGGRNAGDTRPTEYTLTHGGTPLTNTLAGSGPVNNTEIITFDAIEAAADGTLNFSFRTLNTTGKQLGPLKAIRIDSNPLPELSSSLLLSLTFGTLLIRRKR